MKEIDVKDQPSLGAARTFSLTAIGIRYRLFRSLVTVAVVVVAVAFLMNILSESLIKKAIVGATSRRIAELRQAAAWASRLSNPGTPAEIVKDVASADTATKAGDRLYRETQAFGRFSAAEMKDYAARCREAAKLMAFLAELDYGKRRRLVHRSSGTGVFDRLARPGQIERFAETLKKMKSVRPQGGMSAVRRVLAAWPETRRRTARIRAARAAAVARIAVELRGRSLLEALTGADGAFGDAIRRAGFLLPATEAAEVALQAAQARQSRFLEGTALDKRMRKAIAGRVDALAAEVNAQTLWRLLRKRRDAEWYLATLKKNGLDRPGLTAARAVKLAKLEAESRSLARVERLGGDVGGGLMGIGERMTWLALVSMLVCGVGVANAMLMSVTERFREIATLKCLGALDTSIMMMCVVEASLLGLAGGVIGAALGAVLGLTRMAVSFGGPAFASLPVGATFAAMGVSVGVGVVLAAVAALYPSFKAARLAPMEAMRIE